MRRALLAIVTLALTAGASQAAAPRIVSMNICTDQNLLALADPAQVIGLSRFARDGRLGWVEGARKFPILSGGAEDILVLKPDVVTASQFDKRSTREILKANGVNLIELPVPRTLAEVRDQIREMGNIAGHPERATAEIARLDAAIAEARKAAGGKHFRVLPVSRRGWVPGRDSFVGAILAEAGLANAAGELGVDFGGFASLEQIVQLQPDFLVVSDAGERAEDDGSAFLLHPALERFYPRDKRIVIPGRMTECGGVLLADALEALTRELRRVVK
ncbi:ABC transporter substrate-binding protein [Bradyrhizobium lablabi]|uniref:ABC transporter substrate-binding protein n=1 Tax=Bradyrhizobium lablabi TaxID=722472 RepID=UPI001BAB55DE|nr:ABC transporter substrate-binding protein [Bradyrhizobium lablabi]MBR1123572.1 ABC transporter substrate-binding protein [Bradyrhizobium lablabi]